MQDRSGNSRGSSGKTYWVLHHQHKAKPIVEALKKTGWRYQQARASVALFDTPRNKLMLQRLYANGSTIVMYPHSSSIHWWYDAGMLLPKEVSALLVVSEAQVPIQKQITPNVMVEAVGWGYCPVKKFQKPDKVVSRILFAPMHPNGKKLRPEAVQANVAVYSRLLKMKDHQICVRLLGNLEDNGLWYSPKVIYNYAKPDGSYTDIDLADVVIAEGMFLNLAVARGKPAIGMNQRIPIRCNGESSKVPENWDVYGKLTAYPVDFSDGDDIMELINKATEEPIDWKRQFIGDQLDAENVSRIITKIREQDAAKRKKPVVVGASPARG